MKQFTCQKRPDRCFRVAARSSTERCSRKASEAEEQVFGRDVIGLDRFLVDVIWVLPDGSFRSTSARRAERVKGRERVYLSKEL